MSGKEVCKAFESFNYDSWDKSSIEQVYLNFCEQILGLNGSKTNLYCRAELGPCSLEVGIDFKFL